MLAEAEGILLRLAHTQGVVPYPGAGTHSASNAGADASYPFTSAGAGAGAAGEGPSWWLHAFSAAGAFCKSSHIYVRVLVG